MKREKINKWKAQKPEAWEFASCRFLIYYEYPSRNSLWWQAMSDENYHSNEINTCLPPKLKSADIVYDREKS